MPSLLRPDSLAVIKCGMRRPKFPSPLWGRAIGVGVEICRTHASKVAGGRLSKPSIGRGDEIDEALLRPLPATMPGC